MEAAGFACGPTEIARGHPGRRICRPHRDPARRDLKLRASCKQGVRGSSPLSGLRLAWIRRLLGGSRKTELVLAAYDPDEADSALRRAREARTLMRFPQLVVLCQTRDWFLELS